MTKEEWKRAIEVSPIPYEIYREGNFPMAIVNLESTEILRNLAGDAGFVIGISKKYGIEKCITAIGDFGEDDKYIPIDDEEEVRLLLDQGLRKVFGLGVEELIGSL